MTHKVSLIHIERSSQSVHVNDRLCLCAHDEVLVIVLGVLEHTSGVVLRGREHHQVGRFLNGGGHSVGVRSGESVNGYGMETTSQNLLCQQILHGDELIVVGGGIHLVNDTGDELRDAVSGQERLSQLLLLNSCLVELLIVHNMERRAHIGNLPLVNFLLGNSRVILERLGDVYENLFDSLAVFQHTLFEHLPRVGVHLAGENHTTNAIHQSGQELILELGHIHNDSANLTNVVRVIGSDRYIVLIIDGGAITNSVQHINRTIGEGFNLRLSGHFYVLLS